MFEAFDIAVTTYDASPTSSSRVAWVSASSRLGVVHNIPRELSPDTLALADEYSTSVGVPNERLIERASAALGGMVFGVPDIETLFTRTRGAITAAGGSVLFRILPNPAELARLPWELIADPHRGSHRLLAMAPDVVVTRSPRVRTHLLRAEPSPRPLRLLLVASSPPAAPAGDQFDAYEDRRAVLDELEALRVSGHVEVTTVEPPTLEHLRRAISAVSGGFHVVHFVGHATAEALILEGANGRQKFVDSQALVGLLQECPDLRLIVLAGCETAMHSDPMQESPDGPLRQLSIAEVCVRDVCDSVIGMQARLPFATEKVFVAFLYRALASGRDVGQAVRLARAAVKDDERIGWPRLDFSIPTLMMAGSALGPLVDSASPARRTELARARTLKRNLVETDPMLTARPAQLRFLVDFLAGRTQDRLLYLTGPPRSGKTGLVARALIELEPEVECILYERLRSTVGLGGWLWPRRTSGKLDLKDLISDVAELIREHPSADIPTERTWAWIVEQIITHRFVLAIDEATGLTANMKSSDPLSRALGELAGRRGKHRIVIIGNTQLYKRPALPYLPGVITLSLSELTFEEIRRWGARNLPALFGQNADELTTAWFRLGSDLAKWRELARLAEVESEVLLGQLVDQIMPPAALALVEESPEGEPEGRGPVLVAVAGPYLENRQGNFAEAVMRVAERYEVAARLTSTAGDKSSVPPFGQLSSLPSVVAKSGQGQLSGLLKWINDAMQQHADILMADVQSRPHKDDLDNALEDALEHTLKRVTDSGTLVIAASNRASVTWPARSEHVLAVGSLTRTGQRGRGASYDPSTGKPDLFAPGYVTGTELENVPTTAVEGPVLAALHVVVAATVLWAAAPDLGPRVGDVLVETSRPVPDGSGARQLDLDAAIREVRQRSLISALEASPADVVELMARTGLSGPVIEETVNDLAEHRVVERRGTQIRVRPRLGPLTESLEAAVKASDVPVEAVKGYQVPRLVATWQETKFGFYVMAGTEPSIRWIRMAASAAKRLSPDVRPVLAIETRPGKDLAENATSQNVLVVWRDTDGTWKNTPWP